MEKDEYRKMFELEDTYWWFAGRRHLVRRLIGGMDLPAGARILDAGCGTGAGLDNLERFGKAFGVDFSPDALAFCRRRGKPYLLRTRLEALGVRDASFDVITILDVLEHIDDDAKVLASLLRALKPGGRLIVTVPAYPFLWSEHDEALHHKRRYRVRELAERVTSAGFVIRRMSGLVTSFLPLIVFFRMVQKLFPHKGGPKTSFLVLPKIANDVLKGILMTEVEISTRVGFPAGVTLYLVAEKPATVEVAVAPPIPILAAAAS
ncbi:MAG: class I SAM-dependent methyltransferase [Acidobacteriota bacterium]